VLTATAPGAFNERMGHDSGRFGNPANALAQAVFAGLGLVPGIPGLIGKGPGLGLGVANQLGIARCGKR